MTIILCISMVVDLLIFRLFRQSDKWKKVLFVFGLVFHILLLLFFKYTKFLIGGVEMLFHQEFVDLDLIAPLAISFFTFQQIACLVNVYQEKLDVSPLDYILYVLYYPKLISGPLADPGEIIAQFNEAERKHPDLRNIACGLRLFGYGLFKKIIFADSFGKMVYWGSGNIDQATSADLIIIMLSYTFEIYLDFSGYSDMATGVSMMFNIDLPINFDSPYRAVSVRDFWKRWHISLTRFFTKYLYIPLGGNRKGKIRTYLNTLIVFLISGLWHGANFTFILWGALHGMLCIFDRITEKIQNRMPRTIRWLVTFMIINVLWSLFSVDSIGEWACVMTKIFSLQGHELSQALLGNVSFPEIEWAMGRSGIMTSIERVRLAELCVLVVGSFVLCLVSNNNFETRKKLNVPGALLSGMCFAWAFISLTQEQAFIYSGF